MRVAASARSWQKLWCEKQEVDELDAGMPFEESTKAHIEALGDLLSWIPHGGFRCGKLVVTPEKLIKRARKSENKAPGADTRRIEQLLKLPYTWWCCFADLWNVLLRGQITIPEIWAACRTVLLPKTDGSFRPLGIAAVAWRLGSSCLMHEIGIWAGE